MSVSIFDHPLLSPLLGDDRVASLFSLEAELHGAEMFEAALASATAAEGFIPEGAAQGIIEGLKGFTPDLELLAAATARDGVMVPGLIAQMRETLGAEFGPHLHFGATSQDVIDTSLVLRLREGMELLGDGVALVVNGLDQLEERFGEQSIQGVTRMQAALPIGAASRIGNWRAPLERHLVRLNEIKPRLLVLQFGGAVGTLNKFDGKGDDVAQRLAAALELSYPEQCWHNQRDGLAEFAGWLSLVTGSLGKMGQDLALMAQNSVGEVAFEGAGGSSAMPHKQNPVGAEVLVSLARFNAVQVSAMHHSLVHENERSGAAWMLEWMILPQMVVATAGALNRAGDLLASIKSFGR